MWCILLGSVCTMIGMVFVVAGPLGSEKSKPQKNLKLHSHYGLSRDGRKVSFLSFETFFRRRWDNGKQMFHIHKRDLLLMHPSPPPDSNVLLFTVRYVERLRYFHTISHMTFSSQPLASRLHRGAGWSLITRRCAERVRSRVHAPPPAPRFRSLLLAIYHLVVIS